MFSDNAVLLLGAGASTPYGYPIGPQLIDEISAGLDSLPPNLHGARTLDDFNFLRDPCRAAFCTALNRQPTWIHSNFYTGGIATWKQLGDRLRHDPCPSIDEFARANPTQRGAVKLLIAAQIAARTYDEDAYNQGNLAPKSALITSTRQGWYGRLLSHLRRHFRDADAFDPNHPLTIITFNYDRSLELFLEHEMPRAERYSSVKWDSAVSTLHVHGDVHCERPSTTKGPGTTLMEGVLASAEKMLVVDDPRQHNDPAKVAITLLSEASNIVSLGFDYHEQNVELLQMRGSKYAHKIRALNYAGSRGFNLKAERAGISPGNIWSRGPKYSIVDAIDDGIFEV